MGRWWLAVGLWACAGDDEGPKGSGADADTDTDSDTDSDTDTDTDTDTDLSVTCAGTDNALRFSCDVVVSPAQGVTLTAARGDGTGARVVRSDALATEHTLDLVFLSPETTYDVEVTAGTATAATSLTTTAPPTALAARLLVTGTSTTPYVGMNLYCMPNAAVAGVFDTATGDLVWYHELQGSGSLAGFNMAQFTEDHTVLGLTGSTVVEVDLMGRDLLREPYSRNFNHDLFRRDGLTWILYSRQSGPATLQGVSVWDRSGNEIAEFYMGDSWPIPGSANGDWTHANSVWVDDAYTAWISIYQQNSIVKIDGDPGSPTFGEIDWVLAGDPAADGLGSDFALDFDAVTGVDGFGRQHNATFRSDGRLMMLDNASGRGLVGTVDEGAMTFVADEVYPTGARSCGPQGTTTATAAGGMLVGCSGDTLLEFAAGGATPVWEGQVDCLTASGPGVGGLGATRWYALDGW